jgi:hypothetical protein
MPGFFLELLTALRFKNQRFDDLRLLNDANWERLLQFTDHSHLTLLLDGLPSDVLPTWVADRITQNVLDNSKRCETIGATYQEIARALLEARVDHLVVKGFTQAPGFVKQAHLRMQSDIDIFVPKEHILAARDAILQLGYEERSLPPNAVADHLPTLVRPTNWQWRGNHFDPEMPPSIELHFCLWNEEAALLPVQESEDFWDRRLRRNIGTLEFVGLHPVDQLAFLSLHILRDLFRTHWVVRHVYELAFFLNSHAEDRDFWKSWCEIHSESTRSLQVIALKLALLWFQCEMPQEAIEQMEKASPSVKQWFIHFSNSPLQWMFTPNHDSVWLHISLVHSFPLKLRIALRKLLPNRIPPLRAGGDIQRATSRGALISYLIYFGRRMRHFSYAFPRSMWRGTRWWASLHRARS